MSWVRLDDQWHEHPKFTGLGDLGELMWVKALTYACRFRTGGFIPAGRIAKFTALRNTAQLEAKLVKAGLWIKVEDGYQIHDFDAYQPNADKRSQGSSPWRATADRVSPSQRDRIIDRDGLVCRLCGEPVERTDVEIDHIVPVSKGGETTDSNLRVTHMRCNRSRVRSEAGRLGGLRSGEARSKQNEANVEATLLRSEATSEAGPSYAHAGARAPLPSPSPSPIPNPTEPRAEAGPAPAGTARLAVVGDGMSPEAKAIAAAIRAKPSLQPVHGDAGGIGDTHVGFMMRKPEFTVAWAVESIDTYAAKVVDGMLASPMKSGLVGFLRTPPKAVPASGIRKTAVPIQPSAIDGEYDWKHPERWQENS